MSCDPTRGVVEAVLLLSVGRQDFTLTEREITELRNPMYGWWRPIFYLVRGGWRLLWCGIGPAHGLGILYQEHVESRGPILDIPERLRPMQSWGSIQTYRNEARPPTQAEDHVWSDISLHCIRQFENLTTHNSMVRMRLHALSDLAGVDFTIPDGVLGNPAQIAYDTVTHGEVGSLEVFVLSTIQPAPHLRTPVPLSVSLSVQGLGIVSGFGHGMQVRRGSRDRSRSRERSRSRDDSRGNISQDGRRRF